MPRGRKRRVVALLSLQPHFLAPQTAHAASSTARQKPPPKKRGGRRLKIATNRKARFTYEIIKTMEAGIALQGTEVKSCRDGNANIADGFARIEKRRVHADQRGHCEAQNDGRLLPARRAAAAAIVAPQERDPQARGGHGRSWFYA